MKRSLSIAALTWLIGYGCAEAQSVAEEVTITAGASTDTVGAVATQARAFGELKSLVRFYAEGSWGARSATGSDAFGAAYPYNNHFRLMEAYAERGNTGGDWLAIARVGRYRTPFGISGRADHSYTGFLRAPLMRYDDYWGISNNFLEGGVDVIVGRPSINVELSLGVPQDVGSAIRQSGFDRVLRVQAYRGAFIVGMSRLDSPRYDRRFFAKGNLRFTGVDARWMAHGIQLRGEWMGGHPFNGVSTTGWYLDGLVHRARMGAVTVLGRVENLDYEAGVFSEYGKRLTGGARIQVGKALIAQINLIHQWPDVDKPAKTAVDIAFTYVVRHPR